jgi:hypothetical protein
MCIDNNKNKDEQKEMDDMEATINYPKGILDKISDKLNLATGKGKMLKLDRNNPDDMEWYEEDDNE